MNPNAATASWTASSWLGGLGRAQQQTSLKKTIQAYKALSHRLKTKLEQLLQKREDLSSRAFVMVHEVPCGQQSVEVDKATPTSVQSSNVASTTPTNSQSAGLEIGGATPALRTTPNTRMEVAEDYHIGDVSSLASAVTNILIESMEIRLSYVMEAIQYLTTLYNDNPKQRTPAHLMLSRYEEWVDTNQRLFELNSRLYDLEKMKFDLQRQESEEKGGWSSLQRPSREEFSHTGSILVQSNALKIQSFLSRYQFPSHTPSTTQTYLQEVLTQRGDRLTLEAQKVQEFVNDCIQNSKVDLDNVTGGHPECYQQFMAVLCNFMVERQREVQGVHLPLSMVYSMVEHVVVPQIQGVLLRYVQQRDRDARIREQCEKFSNVTLQQMKVKPVYWSPELEPFMDSISMLRAIYFSPTPSDKMSGVVSAAKALYDQLSTLGENSIDGDSFLDLWIYVTIKANVPDLATNIEFMSLYGDPALGMNEAGYYLTTLSVAANFIEKKLQQKELATPEHPERFVVCEREKFRLLSGLAGSCFRVESEREELQGYKVAVIRSWVLNRARLFCSVLLHTGDSGDTAVVSVISLSSEYTMPANVDYFSKKLTKPHLDLEGLRTQTTPLGQAVTLDLQIASKSLYFMLDGGDFDQSKPQIEHISQLIRLGSVSTEQSYDITQDSPQKSKPGDKEYVYVFTPPQEDLEDSFAHRRLTQFSEAGGRSPDHDSFSSSLKARSVSDSGSLGQQASDYNPSLLVSPSPYLLSYSPKRSGMGLEDTRSDLPADSGEKSQHSKWGGWRLSKLRTSLLRGDSGGSPGSYRPLHENPSVTIANSVTDETERDHAPGPTYSLSQHNIKGSGSQESREHQDSVYSTTSDLEPENDDSYALDRLAKSENFSVQARDGSTPREDGSASPALARLRNSLRARFRRQPSKKSTPAHYRTTLAIPSQSRPQQDQRSKVRSRTATEERYIKPRERGRGSFVVIKIKEPGPEEFLSQRYIKKVEENFRINHLFGSLTVDVEEGMENIIRQGQMYLQHLNFLSLAVPINGTFSDITLTAVRKFQESHNKHDSSFSSSLLVDGYLTSVTFQYLRQAFLTLYASMFRLGLLGDLVEGFDPTSTREEDVAAFRDCVGQFQESYGLQCSHSGVLCQHTIAIISERLTQHSRVNNAV